MGPRKNLDVHSPGYPGKKITRQTAGVEGFRVRHTGGYEGVMECVYTYIYIYTCLCYIREYIGILFPYLLPATSKSTAGRDWKIIARGCKGEDAWSVVQPGDSP